MMDPKLPLPIDVMDDHCGPDESLIRGCEELRRELCACLGALLPVVSKQADAERRASIADANVNLRRGSKDDGSTIGASRARGGLKKQRSQGSDDFAVDDLSLTLAVASLLKSLYVALDSCGEDPLSRSEQNGSPSSASTAAPGTADAGRLVAAIVSRKEEALNLNDFLSLMADADVGHGDFAANQPSDAINAEATLAKAPMEPVRANIKQLDLKNMTPQQSAAWKDVDRGISLVLSIAAKRTTQGRSIKESEIEVVRSDGSAANIDFGGVVSAIDRVLETLPRLENQRVFLSDRQQRVMDTAQLSAAVNRMLRFGRMDGQRVRFEDTRYSKLNDLIQSIEQAGKRSLASQRAELSQEKRDQIDISRVQRAIEKSSRGRMFDQTFFAKEERLLDIIASLRLDGHLAGKMDQQYYEMSQEKEKEMFVVSVGSKLARLRRLSAQATYSPQDRDRMALDELERVLDSVLTRTAFKNQRAGKEDGPTM